MSDSEFAVDARGLTRNFGNLVAVNGLDLKIPKARIYGFLGPNGSGKTTAIRMLCGLLSPSAGCAEVMGFQIPEQAEQLRTRIGYMTQKFSLYEDLTVLENLRFMGKIFSMGGAQLKTRIEELLQVYDLQALRNNRASDMSGGQRQRVALAAATLHKPEMLFLDEPTSAVDPENRRDFWEKLFDLCEQHTTILVSTHYMDEAERCHQLAILTRGKLMAEGTPQNLMADIGANVVEIASDHLRDLKQKLLALPQVRSAAQQGIRLRVLIEREQNDPVEFLKKQLPEFSGNMSVVHASLEDVFVTVTQKEML
ncbi:ABC-2 type transport system ATP-binding protein [Alteromonadaceae bacterium 2753L.S.0a.02]|nr:ABC-2 type transport system ATP-binding protein [Alteromonadaceae bacterium 2753L.S.0a.02]